MTSPAVSRFAIAGIAAGMAWSATLSWSGLVEEAYRFVGPGFVAALLIVVVGAGARSLGVGWYLVPFAQLVTLTVWFQHRQGTGTLLGGWLPTPAGIRGLIDQVHAGAAQVNHFPAPVDAAQAQAPVYLLAISILLMIGVDLIACGLRRAPWAGLPIIVALTVPISVLDGGLPAPVFLLTGILFVVLLATTETERLRSWDQATSGRRGGFSGSTAITTAAVGIGTATAISALILPIFVPVGAGILNGDKGGGSGGGAGGRVTLTNPLVDLRRDLVRNSHVPLLDVVTDSPDPTYVRISVLDRFTGSAWQPSPRNLQAANKAVGSLPDIPGVRAGTIGVQSQWRLTTSRAFFTSWLPTPYSPRNIAIDRGDWRYDSTTLDIASADETPPVGVDYSVSALTPTVDPGRLNDALPAPPDLVGPMTQVPNLNDAVTQKAIEVTSAGKTDYQKAALLQEWFRNDGHFTYSLEQRPGTGMDQLVRFITTDKIGYCEQFAAAMAVMARSIGIPARVVVGFLGPSDGQNDRYTYTTDDLHAWPEVYFTGSGWVRFEPTPSARTGSPPFWTLGQVNAPATEAPSASASALRPSSAPTTAPVDVTSGQSEQGGTSPVVPLLVGVLALVVLATIPTLLRTSRRRRRLRPDPDPRIHVAALWAELRATVIDLGIEWPRGRSAREIARMITSRWAAQPEELRELDRLVVLVERARYGRDFDADEDDLESARSTVVLWSALLTRTVPRSRVRQAKVFPRSVFERTSPVESEDPHLTPVG